MKRKANPSQAEIDAAEQTNQEIYKTLGLDSLDIDNVELPTESEFRECESLVLYGSIPVVESKGIVERR